MNVSDRLGRIYARALIEVGERSGTLDRIVDDLRLVQALYADPSFRSFFTSPRLDSEVKRRLVHEALKDKLDRPVLGLLHVLIDKRREALLDNVADQFVRFKEMAEGVLHATVRTARPLDEGQKEAIVSRLERATNKRILLHESVEPKLLGGVVVRLGDKVLDASIRRRLDKLRRQMAAARG